MKINVTLEELTKYLETHCKFLGQGNGRICYLAKSGKNVIKLPYEGSFDDGDQGNWNEWKKFSSGWQQNFFSFAKCRVAYTSDDRVILFMEFVIDLQYVETFNEEVPDWVSFIDCAQVGLNFKGNLVAYDYGNF